MLGIKKLPPHIPAAFVTFLKTFRPCSSHSVADLTILYEFTKELGCHWDWLAYSADRVTIIADATTLILPESGAIVTDFANEHELYSGSFFKTFEHVMAYKSLQKGFASYLQEFFDFVKNGTNRSVTFDLLLQYRDTCAAHPDKDINGLGRYARSLTT